MAPLVFQAPEGPAVGPGRCVCRWAAARWAGLLYVPMGGGPPARRPRREPSARRVASKPGQAPPPPTGTAARPLKLLRRPPHQWCLVTDRRVVSKPGQAPRPRR